MADRRQTSSPWRDGMTLVELLVVVAIVTALFALSANSLRPALENRKRKEASRILVAAFAQAKARAMQLRRPVGLWIQGDDNLGDTNFNTATAVYLAETPPPYSGDFENSRCQFAGTHPTNSSWLTFNVTKTENSRFAGNSPLVKVGDEVKFNYREPAYRITEIFDPDPSNNGVPVRVAFTPGIYPPPQGATAAYQVIRQPERTGPPIELPQGICIDLRNSGLGPGDPDAAWRSPMADSSDPTDLSTHDPPPGVEFQLRVNEPGDASALVLFSPNGSVQSVFRNANSRFRSISRNPPTIHFLIGELDQMQEAAVSPLPFSNDDGSNEPFSFNVNQVDLGALWVSVGARSGNVTSSENVFSAQGTFTESLQTARFLASQSQNLGAR